jgi:hypothetical protein
MTDRATRARGFRFMRRAVSRAVAALVAAVCSAGAVHPAAAQAAPAVKPTPPAPSPVAAAAGERCRLEVVSVGDSGRVEETPEGTNYYGGGGVRLRCRGLPVTMEADSVAYYGGRRTEFIRNVRYRDTTLTLDADRLTYIKDGERFEARGKVKTRNLRTGSTLAGPSLDYFRKLAGVRDTEEMFAVGRPRVEYAGKDSTGRPAEPYVIVGDRIRTRGDDQVWAGGKVTVDRSDFAARADSLRLDTGAADDGTLVGTAKAPAALRGLGNDSFDLTGRRIDFTLRSRDLDSLAASGSARAVNAGWDLVADTIALKVASRKLQHTWAWGDSTRPHATSKREEVRADSLALDTPDQQLRAVRAYGSAWLAQAPDSATKERDWLVGDTVVAEFAPKDSGQGGGSALRAIAATHAARAYYRATPKSGGRPSLNYVRGDFIRITMKPDSSEAVSRVDVRGRVDGVQLEPEGGAGQAAPATPAPSGGPPAVPRAR